MIRSVTSRSAGIALLAATCAALLLALAGSAGARTTACSARTSREARACAPSHRHHGKRPHGNRKHKHASSRRRAANSVATRLAPTCENGATLTLAAGAPACSDGSEPQCALNTTPVFTAAGAVLYCTPDTLPGEEECGTENTQSCDGSTASSPAAPACQDGSEASLNLEGVYACDDGSEPHCGEGFSLTISESGMSLVCEPATAETAES